MQNQLFLVFFPFLSLRANLVKSLNVSECLHNIFKSFADKGRFRSPKK